MDLHGIETQPLRNDFKMQVFEQHAISTAHGVTIGGAAAETYCCIRDLASCLNPERDCNKCPVYKSVGPKLAYALSRGF